LIRDTGAGPWNARYSSNCKKSCNEITDNTIYCVFYNKYTIYIENLVFHHTKAYIRTFVRQPAKSPLELEAPCRIIGRPIIRLGIPGDGFALGQDTVPNYWTSNNPPARSAGETADQNPEHNSGGFPSWRNNSPKQADILASSEYFDKKPA